MDTEFCVYETVRTSVLRWVERETMTTGTWLGGINRFPKLTSLSGMDQKTITTICNPAGSYVI